jgi:hypothetical protein
VDRATKQMKRLAGDVAQVTGAVSAVAAAAVGLASTVDGPVKASMQEVQRSTQLLAVQVADVLRPALHEAATIVRGAAEAFASLSPAQKAAASDMAVMAVQATAAAKGVQLAAQAGNVLAGAFSSALGVVRALASGPLLALVALTAAVGAAAALAYRAWRTNWAGIQEATASLVGALRDAFGGLVSFVGEALSSVLRLYEGWLNRVVDGVDALQRLTGAKLVDVDGLRAGFAGLFKDLRDGSFLRAALDSALDSGRDLGGKVAEGVQMALEDFGLDKLFSGISRAFSGGAGGLIGLGRGAAASSAGGGGGTDPYMARYSMDAVADRRLGELAREAQEEARINEQRLAAWKAYVDNAQRMAQQEGQMRKAQEDAARASSSATLSRVAGVASYGGEAGGVIAKVLQGFSQGLEQGVLTAVMEVVSRMESFGAVTQQASAVLDALVKALEPILGPAFLALGTLLQQGVLPIIQALQPVMEAFGEAFTVTADIFGVLAPILAGLAPLLGIVASLFKALSPVLEILSTALMYIVKFVGTVVLAVVKGILWVWNGLIEAIAAVVGIFDASAAAQVRKMKGDMAAVDKAMADLDALTPESLRAQRQAMLDEVRKNNATNDATKALKEFTAALTNVPTGYNSNYALYTVGGGGRAHTYDAGGGAGDIIIEKVEVRSSEDLADALDELERRRRARRNGNPTRRDDL